MFKLLIWFGVFIMGGVLGMYVKPRTIAIAGAALMVVVVASMVLANFLSSHEATEHTFVFGLAMLLIPIFFAVVYMGASFGEKFKSRRR